MFANTLFLLWTSAEDSPKKLFISHNYYELHWSKKVGLEALTEEDGVVDIMLQLGDLCDRYSSNMRYPSSSMSRRGL
jgi:hypothetical protein